MVQSIPTVVTAQPGSAMPQGLYAAGRLPGHFGWDFLCPCDVAV